MRGVVILTLDKRPQATVEGNGKTMVSFEWTPIRYRSIIAVLKNPFYAGAYVYGKSEKRTVLVDGRARTTYKHDKPADQWDVVIKDHHEGYIEWSEFERNQKILATNAYGKAGGVKSGRGGRALLPAHTCPHRWGSIHLRVTAVTPFEPTNKRWGLIRHLSAGSVLESWVHDPIAERTPDARLR